MWPWGRQPMDIYCDPRHLNPPLAVKKQFGFISTDFSSSGFPSQKLRFVYILAPRVDFQIHSLALRSVSSSFVVGIKWPPQECGHSIRGSPLPGESMGSDNLRTKCKWDGFDFLSTFTVKGLGFAKSCENLASATGHGTVWHVVTVTRARKGQRGRKNWNLSSPTQENLVENKTKEQRISFQSSENLNHVNRHCQLRCIWFYNYITIYRNRSVDFAYNI